MRKFIYPFAMMAGLIIASSCTENEGARMRELRTRSISTAASASDNTGNPDAAPDANCPSPDTRMAYEDNNEAGMALSWQPTDAFKGFYTTPHVQEVVDRKHLPCSPIARLPQPVTTLAPGSRETLPKMWMRTPLSTSSILLPAAPETRGRKPKPP